MAKAYNKLYTLAYDSTAITGCLGMNWNHIGASLVTLIDGAGTLVSYPVTPTAVGGTFTFQDPDEAEKMAEKATASKNITFKVLDEAGAAYTVTITNVKTSAVLGGAHNLGGSGPYTVQWAADSISDPVVDEA